MTKARGTAGVLVLAFAAMASIAQAQVAPPKGATPKPMTPEQIVARSIEVAGGAKRLTANIPMVLSGSVDFGGGAEGSAVISTTSTNRIAMVFSLENVGVFKIVVDGDKGWIADPLQGVREMTDGEIAEISGPLFGVNPRWKEVWSSLERKPDEVIAGKTAYVIRFVSTNKKIADMTNSYDSETFLLLRSETTVETVEVTSPSTVNFSDYREVDGLKIPYRLEQHMPLGAYTLLFTDVTVGRKIDDSVFAKPGT